VLCSRDVVSVEMSRSRDVLISSRSHLGLGAICLGLGSVSLVSGLGPLRLVETFCAGARRAQAYCSCIYCNINQHDICGLDNIRLQCFLSFIYLFIVKQNFVVSVFFRHKMT